jgi:hypothetical protein
MRARYERTRLLLVTDVGLDRERSAAVACDLSGELLDPLTAASGQRDGGAYLRTRERGRLADARRRAGDDVFARRIASFLRVRRVQDPTATAYFRPRAGR